jgi:CBS domain-containing protein
MKKRTLVSAVMSRDITAIHRGMRLSEAYDFLRATPFHHLPVVEGRRPVGMISSSDFLRLVYAAEATGTTPIARLLDDRYSVDDAMSSEIRSLPQTATVHDAAELLSDGEAHSVVIVDDRGELVGIVTTTDLVRYLRDQSR